MERFGAGARIELVASQSEIQAMADKIVSEFHPERIILFGSHARGEAKPDSNVEGV
jgi:uncharacterized protein